MNIAEETALTWAALGLGLALVAINVWREHRPRNDLRVSIVPTTPLILAGAFIAVLAVVHLLAIYGVDVPRRR